MASEHDKLPRIKKVAEVLRERVATGTLLRTPLAGGHPPGVFVVFEGGDACGKTTQVDMLHEKLSLLGVDVVKISFPRYDTPVGKLISRHLRGAVWLTDGSVMRDPDVQYRVVPMRDRQDALVFQALQTLDKYEEAARIKEHLDRGVVVVSSRWYQSAEIYGADDGLDEGVLRRAHACLPRADVNFLLNLSAGASLALRPDLRDRFERDADKQVRVRKRYLATWDAEYARRTFADPEGPPCWPVVDCEGKAAAEVHDHVWETLLKVPKFVTLVCSLR